MSEFFCETSGHLKDALDWLDRLRGTPSCALWRDFHDWLAAGPTRLAALLRTGQDLRALADQEQDAGLDTPLLSLLLVSVDLLCQERFKRQQLRNPSRRRPTRLHHRLAAHGTRAGCRCRTR